MTKLDQNTFSDLIESLYGGLLETKPWERFLRSFAASLDATYTSLILTAPGMMTPGTILTPGGPAGPSEEYAESFFASDPFKGLPDGKVMAFAEFLGGLQARESDFYRDFLASAGGDQILGVDLRFESGFEARLRATRDRSLPDFGATERAKFQQIVPHLRHALRLFERLQVSGAEHGVYRGTVEQMGVAAIILDSSGRVVRTNAVADRLLKAGDGIVVADTRLRLKDAEKRKILEQMLKGLDEEPMPQRLRIARVHGHDLAAIAKPIAAPAFMRGGAALALFVSDPGQDTEVDPEVIRDLFQLTRMEATLAVALANGRSLVEAADSLGIAHKHGTVAPAGDFCKDGCATAIPTGPSPAQWRLIAGALRSGRLHEVRFSTACIAIAPCMIANGLDNYLCPR